MSRRTVQFLCYGVSFCAMLGAGGYLMLGTNKGLGILLLIVAVIISRVLLLDVASRDS